MLLCCSSGRKTQLGCRCSIHKVNNPPVDDGLLLQGVFGQPETDDIDDKALATY